MNGRHEGITVVLVALAALGTGRAAAQRSVTGSAIVTLAKHRLDFGAGVQQASGALIGGELQIGYGGLVELTASAQGGTLEPDSASAERRDVADAALELGVLAVPWLAVQGGVTRRTYETPLARQRWTLVRFGAEARLVFLGGAVRGVLRAALAPVAKVSGLQSPDLALLTGAAVEWRKGLFSAGLTYGLERYDFPEQNGARRLEQLSSLTARVGLRLGR